MVSARGGTIWRQPRLATQISGASSISDLAGFDLIGARANRPIRELDGDQ